VIECGGENLSEAGEALVWNNYYAIVTERIFAGKGVIYAKSFRYSRCEQSMMLRAAAIIWKRSKVYMITLKEQAVKMVQSFPDEKMSYVVDMLKWVTGILDDKSINAGQMPVAASGYSSEAIDAWERFKQYKGIIPYDIDTKVELAKARDEKYADFI
jgi:hypothetical protein